jgi:hypothetical protein
VRYKIDTVKSLAVTYVVEDDHIDHTDRYQLHGRVFPDLLGEFCGLFHECEGRPGADGEAADIKVFFNGTDALVVTVLGLCHNRLNVEVKCVDVTTRCTPRRCLEPSLPESNVCR